MSQIHRRDFLKTAAAAVAATAFHPGRLFAEETTTSSSRVVAVKGTDIPQMLEAGIREFGGWEAIVPKGQKVTLKPNVGWASTPEQGANTNPEIVEAFIRACWAAGAATVVLPENPCSSSDKSFAMSGIGAVAQRTGARLYEPVGLDFQEVDIPKGKILQKAAVVKDVLETGCLINMPVAKSHGGGIMTASMKNWMGTVQDRGFWHRNGLHQCIADFSTLIRATLIIVDATRIMVTNGPRGPGRMETPNQIVFGTDPVAMDAYVATLFHREPFSIPYIQIAHDMGIGCGDMSKVTIQRIVA